MPVYKLRNLKNEQATPIPAGRFDIGRGDATHVHIEDASVSRLHGYITNSDDGVFIEDAGSSNGTALEGIFVTQPTRLQLGQTVYIGSIPFRLDPETVAEPIVLPSIRRPLGSRSYMRRDTERLPANASEVYAPPAVPAEELSAPPLSSNDGDAAEMNAVTLIEPPAPVHVPEPAAAAPTIPVPHVTHHPVPTIHHPEPTPRFPEPTARAGTGISVRPAVASMPTPAPSVPSGEALASSSSGSLSWTWRLALFLAGLGVGLLLGLMFAKTFIEMGGHAGALP